MHKRLIKIMLPLLGAFLVAAWLLPAGGSENGSGSQSRLTAVSGEADYQRILENSRGRLTVIDYYANWCSPCRRLAPVLESVADHFAGKVAFFKIDVDAHQKLARQAGVRGIPFVQFVLDGKPVHAIMGLRPKEAYIREVQRFAPKTADSESESPDGVLVDGVRVVERSARAAFDSVYVFRGETVRLKVTDIDFPYGIAIPQYDIRKEAGPGESLEITFKARKTGIFPVFCNGNCPSGENSRHGQVVVIPFAAGGQTAFAEIDAPAAKVLMETESPLVLDVRTPGEYYGGHLPGARLIPVQQLQARLGEINDHKQKKVLIYCRSGNRSVVAAEILAEAGFTDIAHLSGGILDWQRAGYALVK